MDITTLISLLKDSGLPPALTGIAIVIMLLIYGFKKHWKPMTARLSNIPSKDDLAKSAKYILETINIEKLLDKLDEITDRIDDGEELLKGTLRETIELKRDIDNIKIILNQFQGSMMYGTRSSDDLTNGRLR